jgi:predicted dehydrogenase
MPMTVAALRSGANVFLEKPAAATIQDVMKMKKAQTDTGKFVAVGYQTVYTPELMRIKNDIVGGKIGKLKSIRCYALWPRGDDYYGRNNWAGKLKSGDSWVLDSPYNNALAHHLNQICFFAGETPYASASIKSVEAELYRANRIESADTACIRIRTTSGIPLYFTATHACETFAGPDIVISGNKGEIIWNMQKTVFSYGNNKEELPSQDWDQMRTSIMDRLIARVKDPSAFICTLDIAKVQTICVNGIHESSAINALDEKLLRRIRHKDSYLTVINDIDSVILQSYREEKLFSEMGVEWAHKGSIISMENYNFFPSF